MKKRQLRIIDGAAGDPTTSLECFRVTSKNETTTARAKALATSSATASSAASTCSWLLVLLASLAHGEAVGYSYARFEGPVVGPEHEVSVPNAFGGGSRADYVAQPEYSFAYGVEDGKTRVLQNRKETRHGDEVRGVYSVVDPDGSLRVVKYTADDVNGFQAQVITNGVTTLHGHGDVAAGGAAVEQQVEHDESNEVDDVEQNNDDKNKKKKNKPRYEVHEDYDEGGGEGSGNNDEYDHEEYEGSSEEGYEDAKTQSQEEEDY